MTFSGEYLNRPFIQKLIQNLKRLVHDRENVLMDTRQEVSQVPPLSSQETVEGELPYSIILDVCLLRRPEYGKLNPEIPEEPDKRDAQHYVSFRVGVSTYPYNTQGHRTTEPMKE